MSANSKIKIMIVEDDPLIRQLYQHILRDKGYEVVAIAADGAQAVNIYNNMIAKPDIIILDFRLPIKNGLEVSEEILARNHSTEILMISGDPTFDRKAIISRGISLMQKPVEITDLLNELREISGG